MKRLFSMVLMIFMAGFISGCDDTTNNSETDTIYNNEFYETFTLQGTVFDATTGARLNDTSLSVTLVRGTSYYNPNLLNNNSNHTTFAGDYAFTGIPIALNAGNINYRLVATMNNYQQFEAYISPTAISDLGNMNSTHDTVYNMIGNIYMFPLGSEASDIEIYVEYNGERVSGASVQLQQQIANNLVTAQASNTLAASNGTLAALTATTDANGIATFEGSTLTLGGVYVPHVLPLVYESTQLALTTGAAITVGDTTTDNVQLVNMGDTAPNGEDNGLYIVSASNRDSEDVLSSGVLTITFSEPVALVSEDAFTAALGGGVNTADLAADTVTASVSTDGLVLTLTPNYATNPVPFTGTNEADADIGLTITYTGGMVTLVGDNTNEALNILTGADDILYLNGDNISQVVNITGPQNE